MLAPYRGERIVRQIPIKIPTSASKGPLRILVSDGDTLDRMRRGMPMMARKLDLASTIALLNKEHSNNRVYVSLLEADPEAMVADKVMPALPLSVMNVMDGMRGTQEMVVLGESLGERGSHAATRLCGRRSAGTDDYDQVNTGTGPSRGRAHLRPRPRNRVTLNFPAPQSHNEV